MSEGDRRPHRKTETKQKQKQKTKTKNKNKAKQNPLRPLSSRFTINKKKVIKLNNLNMFITCSRTGTI